MQKKYKGNPMETLKSLIEIIPQIIDKHPNQAVMILIIVTFIVIITGAVKVAKMSKYIFSLYSIMSILLIIVSSYMIYKI